MPDGPETQQEIPPQPTVSFRLSVVQKLRHFSHRIRRDFKESKEIIVAGDKLVSEADMVPQGTEDTPPALPPRPSFSRRKSSQVDPGLAHRARS